MPTGLVGVDWGRNVATNQVIEMDLGSRLADSIDSFKPLSEFNIGDLRDGDFVALRGGEVGYIRGGLIDEYDHGHTFELVYYKADMTRDEVSSRAYDIMKVTRNNEVIYEREEKSETQMEHLIQQAFACLSAPHMCDFSIKDILKLMLELEAKRSAE